MLANKREAIATISGQGLSANKVWDGRLEFSDTTALVRFSGLKSVGYTAAVSTELITPTPAAFLDSLPLFRAAELSGNLLRAAGRLARFLDRTAQLVLAAALIIGRLAA